MIVGDGGSFLNPMRIKGIHLSMKTGMLAAETAFAAALLSADKRWRVLLQWKSSVEQHIKVGREQVR